MTNLAARRYMWRCGLSMAAYMAVLIGCISAIRHLHPEGPLLVILSVLPALPMLAVIWSIFMFIVDQQDEYLRMRQVRQILVGTAFTLAVTTVWGFLEEAHVVPHIPLQWVFVIWCGGLFIDFVIGWFQQS
jgi:uncharacterized YccA/Bax inhibitor family protein